MAVLRAIVICARPFQMQNAKSNYSRCDRGTYDWRICWKRQIIENGNAAVTDKNEIYLIEGIQNDFMLDESFSDMKINVITK